MMQITNTTVSDAAVLGIAGSLDATTVSDFDDAWKAALDSGAAKVVVDLGGVEYISSAGLRGILLLAKTAKAKNARVGFSRLSGMVADMFKLSGFLTILAVFPDNESAAAGL